MAIPLIAEKPIIIIRGINALFVIIQKYSQLIIVSITITAAQAAIINISIDWINFVFIMFCFMPANTIINIMFVGLLDVRY